jgi:hypothetical protein
MKSRARAAARPCCRPATLLLSLLLLGLSAVLSLFTYKSSPQAQAFAHRLLRHQLRPQGSYQMAATKPRILVSGGAGYIGSHTVVELVNAGYPVTIVDNLINSRRVMRGVRVRGS